MIPIITTPEGSVLTGENWQAVGIEQVCCYLDALLMKPGYAVLQAVQSLAQFVGWQGPVVLNALLKRGKEGLYTVRSTYDGMVSRYALDELIQLIITLKPRWVLLPTGMSESETIATFTQLPEGTLPFISRDAALVSYSEYDYGVICSPTYLSKTVSEAANRVVYVLGGNDTPKALADGACNWETNQPAEDAFQGRVYAKDGARLDLEDRNYAMDFSPIDDTCTCPTCAAGFTRAYLHHLYANTPLLCQRYLVQHNVYFMKDNVGQVTRI